MPKVRTSVMPGNHLGALLDLGHGSADDNID